MRKIALIAGGGSLPAEFIKAAHKKGEKVIAFAIRDMASEDLLKDADKIHRLGLGEWGKFMLLALKEGTRHIIFLGKIKKEVIFKEEEYDKHSRETLGKMKNKKDYSILSGITERLASVGIHLLSADEYLGHLLPEKGIFAGDVPDKSVEEDIEFGFNTAKKLADMDVGQTVIIKDKVVVSVEAMEGTDDTISRAGKIAGDGCVMVKVSRPGQDMRWDVPTVGPETIKRLAENKYKALAIESGKMFIVEQERTIEAAKKAGLTIKVL